MKPRKKQKTNAEWKNFAETLVCKSKQRSLSLQPDWQISLAMGHSGSEVEKHSKKKEITNFWAI